MCTLARLNKRLKHLLFHTLLQQEVHFFEENNPGENNNVNVLMGCFRDAMIYRVKKSVFVDTIYFPPRLLFQKSTLHSHGNMRTHYGNISPI